MAIVTRRRADKYTIIPNAAAEDEALSFEARGVLCYLLSKPNSWSVNIDDLARAGRIGRDKVYRILNELRAARYIDRVDHRLPSGRMRQVEYLVYNEAIGVGVPLPEKPETEKPETAQPETEKPDLLVTTENKQELKHTSPQGELLRVLDSDRADAVIEHRKKIRKPMTPHAAKLLAAKFAKCPDPQAAADAMIANGWQGFEPEWLENRKGNTRPGASKPSERKPRTVVDAVKARLQELELEGDRNAIEHQH